MKWSLFLILTLLVSCSSGEKNVNKSVKEKQADLNYSHGTSHLIKKNYTLALDHLITANQMRKNDTKILNNLGMAYFFKKDMGNALKYLKESIETNEQHISENNDGLHDLIETVNDFVENVTESLEAIAKSLN